MLSRRAVIAGGAVLAAVPAWPAAGTDDMVGAALDAAAAEREPKAALALLRDLPTQPLQPGRALDLAAARAGLTVDIALRDIGIDPRTKAPPSSPEAFALLLRRKLGDGLAIAHAEHRLDHERQLCERRAQFLFDALGRPGGATGARYAALWSDDRHLYRDSEAGRYEAVADMNAALVNWSALVPALIGPVPAACLNVAAAKPTGADIAAGHVGFRTLPAPGKSGSYLVDLKDVRRRPRWTLPSVTAHELLPGHMIQMPTEAIAAPHPLRIEYAPAFMEGWGIHAERLVAQAGGYRGDPLGELGYLHWRLFRIGRALVDIGIHCRGLSIDAARAKVVASQGEPAYFAPFDSDLARIFREPATRAAEMLAAIAIEDGARGRRGRSLIAYHQALLVHGRMRSEAIARLGKPA